MKVKTRFAPSPTGYLHIGSARTALYSWLFARHHGGEFVLRIEDTDLKREIPGATKDIIDGMNWLGLEYDEGPYFQTKRFDRYKIIINEMLATGIAYKCFCSKERLNTLRQKQIIKGEKPHYDGHCRYNNNGDYHINDQSSYVVRFANPQNGYVTFDDQIRGFIKFNNKELDDLIIQRTDGCPTYNFCVVVDDWDMGITHVIRGEDHISNTLRQINIFKALNAPLPIYAHISAINGNDGKKLSKRYGAISIMQYRNNGYLPEALLNYLVRLGWSNGNQEIFSQEEMIKLFSLKTINKSASTFNVEKLTWLNRYYINNLPVECVAAHLQWHIEQVNIDIKNGPQLTDMINLFKTRCNTLKDIVEICRYFYEDFNEFDTKSAEQYLISSVYQQLEMIRDKLANISEWTVENIQNSIQNTADKFKVKINKISMPLRVAVTGVSWSPPLNITIFTIGKLRCINRINKALDFIKHYKTDDNV